MWQLIAAQAVMGFLGDSAQAKAQRKYQAYRNKMTKLSEALAQNAITQNELVTNDQFKRQALEIQTSYQEAAGATEVQAGSTYTAGRSVDRSLQQLEQSSDLAESVRQENLINSWVSYDAQRKNAAMSAAMQEDHSYIPKPNLLSYLFKAGTQIMGAK